jgi:hypothetical protein
MATVDENPSGYVAGVEIAQGRCATLGFEMLPRWGREWTEKAK